jgi:PAS domain-containing protein
MADYLLLQVSNLLGTLRTSQESKKRTLYFMVTGLGLLFAAFISLCGLTHAFNIVCRFYPDNWPIRAAQSVFLVFCAVISIATALIGYRIFPAILEILPKYELNAEGDLQHVENSLLEVISLVKESVVVLTEDKLVTRCNEPSKALFGASALLGRSIVEFIHKDDLAAFEGAVAQAFASYSDQPVTVEYRVVKNGNGNAGHRGVQPKCPPRAALLNHHSVKIHVEDSSSNLSSPSPATSTRSTASLSSTAAESSSSSGGPFAWVESTICKGMRTDHSDGIQYDLKMITRNIDERKKQVEAQFQDMLRQTEEQARINAAKLRYITCIAHDLKTPLQSFFFSLDILKQSAISFEQRECLQQASVAADLMKLTISQTMDISKALSGAKLQPRCNTVSLAVVIDRVKVIM